MFSYGLSCLARCALGIMPDTPKGRCCKIMLWVLLAGSLAVIVALTALFIVFQQKSSCPQNETCSCDWIPGSTPVFQQKSSCPQNQACSCDWIPGSSTAQVILDPATAHPRIDLSRDGKTASWGRTEKSLPNNPERFDRRVWVLGRDGFLSDKHCWEVDVKGNGEWAVGVAKQSVQRKGEIGFSTQAGVWAIGEYWGLGNFVAFYPPDEKLQLDKKPRRIRVFLDYKYGQVEFFNAETNVSIYLFNAGSFEGEKIYPWFRVWDGTTLVLHP